jgi:hypothetical protein
MKPKHGLNGPLLVAIIGAAIHWPLGLVVFFGILGSIYHYHPRQPR